MVAARNSHEKTHDHDIAMLFGQWEETAVVDQ